VPVLLQVFRKKAVFFFEKKNQKTFSLAPSSRDAQLIALARNPAGKSFLLLFFKKEVLSYVFFGNHSR
jgi:hypothetical protein